MVERSLLGIEAGATREGAARREMRKREGATEGALMREGREVIISRPSVAIDHQTKRRKNKATFTQNLSPPGSAALNPQTLITTERNIGEKTPELKMRLR
jgi:hypothetical protein